jgi:hypothetical protein
VTGEQCGNLADDDADLLIDCDDQECFGQPSCPPIGWTCPGYLYNAHPPNETCECNCGIADPDCGGPTIPTSDCPPNQACVQGACMVATGEICDNGINDDGDGQVDCADADCAGMGDCPPSGWVCDPLWYDEDPPNEFCDCECGGDDPDCADPGNPVFGCPVGLGCDMGICAPVTGEDCDNATDDDGDQLVDCSDDECYGQPGCPPVGWLCPPQYYDEDPPNEFCDCDCGVGLLDPDCSDPQNPIFGCSPAETCEPTMGVCVPATGEDCDNGVTDDADLLVDCNDPECAGDAACMLPAGWTCDPDWFNEPYPGENCDCECGAADPDCQVPGAPLFGCAPGELCDAQGQCFVPPPEDCDNTIDDDLDTLADCQDPDCVGDPACPAVWTCNPAYYGTNDGCDCGCGIFDPDCPDATTAGCIYCNNLGSCNTLPGCPGTIDPTDNAVCL